MTPQSDLPWAWFQLPLIKPYVQFSRIRLSNHLLPKAFTAPAWPSGIASSEVPEYFQEFLASVQSPAPSFLQKHDEGIAPSLSQGYVVLAIVSVLWATPTPLPTQWNFVLPYIHRLSRYFGTSVRVSCATPHGFPCVSPLLPRESAYGSFVQISVSAFPS